MEICKYWNGTCGNCPVYQHCDENGYETKEDWLSLMYDMRDNLNYLINAVEKAEG